MNMRTSKAAGWTCLESAVTCVRRVSTESAPSLWSVDRKSNLPFKYVLQQCISLTQSVRSKISICLSMQLGGLWAAEHDRWDVHAGEGRVPPLGHLVQQLQVWPFHVGQARPHGKLGSVFMAAIFPVYCGCCRPSSNFCWHKGNSFLWLQLYVYL